MRKTHSSTLLKSILLLYLFSSCTTNFFRNNYYSHNQLLHTVKDTTSQPFIKAHLKNGNVCILDPDWTIDTINNKLRGYGTEYDFNRREIFKGSLNIPLDSVAIYETNKKLRQEEVSRIAMITVLSALNVAGGINCILYPKSCFGSCPTFYLEGHQALQSADAEGFSTAVSPSLEASDIDALQEVKIIDSKVSLTMKNEALETHCVNKVELWCCPKLPNQEVFHSREDKFYTSDKSYFLNKATADEGDVTEKLIGNDGLERFSLSDPKNLKSREVILLEFDQVQANSKLGLVLHFRQSLMTTYLFYSMIGYMGDLASDFMVRMEKDQSIKSKFRNGFHKALGDIEIYCWDQNQNKWVFQNGCNETGPIAINKQISPLISANTSPKVKIKLILNKGLWRIDFAKLVNIVGDVEPVKLKPNVVYNKGKEDVDALRNLSNDTNYLISMPGSEYRMYFNIPADLSSSDFFLLSKGYYIEWMREHWLKDKNLYKLNQLLVHPSHYLKREAGFYKKYESDIELNFWNSRIDTQKFSYYEN